jgi:hypothetical protein
MGETVRVGRRPRIDDGPVEPEPVDHEEAPEHGDSLLPMANRAGDKRANAMWIIGGLLALALAALVWIRVQPTALDEAQDGYRASPKPALEPRVPTVAANPANPSDTLVGKTAQEPEAIEVNVHTDVEQATLLVNGEPRGNLSPEQSQVLKLRPGAYRFEAQSAGSRVAASVVTVRGDMPLDVFLQLPKGASDAVSVAGALAPGPIGTASEHPVPSELEAVAGESTESPHPAHSAPAVPEPPPPATRREHAKPGLEREPSARVRRREHPHGTLPTSVQVNPHGSEAAAAPAKPQGIPDNPF